MAFTEFCCRSGGSNLNAGTLQGSSTEPGTAASFTYAAGTFVRSTGVFTVASGNPLTDGVAVGDFASIYTVGATVTGFVARITARDATTITVSLTAKSGATAAVSESALDATLKVGGAWKGPNAAEAFPFVFAAGTMTNAAGDRVRVNFKNGTSYTLTTAAIHDVAGPISFAGYTTAYGDGGKATISGATTGAAHNILSVTGPGCHIEDFIFENNGDSGATGTGLTVSYGTTSRRIIARKLRGDGILVNTAAVLEESEAYACNQSNTSGLGGIRLSPNATLMRCTAHDNVGSNVDGIICVIRATDNNTLIDCSSYGNGRSGIELGGRQGTRTARNCNCYNNGGAGISIKGSVTGSAYVIENCNLFKNGGYGITKTDAMGSVIRITNCVFGSGTQANTSGQTNGFTEVIEGSVIYTANETPWNDPANGDFTLTGAACRGTGYGTWPTHNGSANATVCKPDIGAAARGGTFPTSAQVETGVTFGAAGTEYTGTFAGGGGYTYGDEDPTYVLTTADGAGTYIPIADSDTVDGGISYGAGEEGTGVNAAAVEAILDARGVTTDNIPLTEQPLTSVQTQAAAAAAIADALEVDPTLNKLDSMIGEAG